jgi:alanine-glyoxylate transaminase/serine-glyoxylate transaminase/serine-pyruvate transaminase
MTRATGRHFLQIPGPTNLPDRVLRAMDRPIIDHRGPEFQKLARGLFEDLKPIFKTKEPVLIFASSGTGAWEAALVNTLSPGDGVLMAETGQFGAQWARLAERLGLAAELLPGDWRHGARPEAIEARLTEDREHRIKAVCILHNETSTGITSRVPELRKAIDRARHPALLMIDTISSLASTDYRHDEWGVDVTIGGAQKGLMLPPGLSFNAISEKARAAAKTAKMPRAYWAWDDLMSFNAMGFFPFTPATNMLFGLRASIDMLNEEGLDNVFARHDRHAEATRRAVQAWGLEICALDPREYSSTITAILLPPGHDADALRQHILERFNLALGAGLGKMQGRLFRIGHLGDFNDLMLMGVLSGVEMGLAGMGVPIKESGVQAALAYLGGNRGASALAAAS